MNEQPIFILPMPLCFDNDNDFREWIRMDEKAEAWKQGSAGFVCKDCTPSYQFEMKQHGRCEHPEVVFGEYRRGDFGGFIPNLKDDRAKNGGTFEKRMIVCNGEEHSLSEWAEIRGITVQALNNRLNRDGWTPEEAFGFVERKRQYVRKRQESNTKEPAMAIGAGLPS